MKPLLILALLASPAIAGGPVLTTEEPHVADARPSSEGRWVVPVIVGLMIIGALAGGDGPGKPVCKGGC